MKRCTRSLWRSGALGLALLMIPLGLSFCSSEGEEGGLGLGEIPANGFPRAERIENLVQLRLTNYAFGFISENLDPLMTMLLGPEGLSFPLQAGVVDTVGIKIPRETTNITLELANVSIVPEQSMNAIGIHVELKSPNHSGLYIELPSSMLWGLEKCSFFATTDQPFPVEAYIRLTIEPDGAMSINFTEDDIQYDLDPLKLSGDGFTCTLTGGTANLAISLLQGAIEPLLTTQIYNAVNDALNGFLCYTCEDSPDECPVGSVCQDGMCMETGGRCHKKALGIEGSLDLGGLLGGFTGDATPRELYLAAMLGGYADVIGRPSPQYAGLELGMVGGTKAANPDASCAPVESYPRTPPARYQYSDVNPHNNNSIYHAVIGITENLLDQAGVSLHNTGALCISLDPSTLDPSIGQYLALSNFALALPSIGEYTHGQNVASSISIQPTEPIDFKIGPGIIDHEERVIEDEEGNPQTVMVPVLRQPLLTVKIPGLRIHISGLVDERVIRLLTIQTDITVAVGLEIADDFSSIEVVFGEDPIVLDNMSIPFSILESSEEETVERLEGLIGGALGMFDLSTMLEPIELPPLDLNGDDVADILLMVQNVTSDAPKDNPPTADTAWGMLSIYAELGIPSQSPTPRPRCDTSARVLSRYMPALETFRDISLTHQERYPYVALALSSQVPGGVNPGDVQYSYQIDGGPWSPAFSYDRLLVQDNRLLLQGVHTIAVRSRIKGVAYSTDLEPALITFVTDFTKPELTVKVDGERLLIAAQDNLTASDAIDLTYRVGEGLWTAIEGGSLAMDRLPSAASVEVRATDEAGQSAMTAFTKVGSGIAMKRAPKTLTRAAQTTPAIAESTTMDQLRVQNQAAAPLADEGCASGSFAWVLGFAAAGYLVLRRRARGAMAGLLGLALVSFMAIGCGGGSATNNQPCTSEADCNQGYTCINNQCQPVSVDGDPDLVEQVEEVEEGPVSCNSDADCIVSGEPADKYYCSTTKHECRENICYGDNADTTCQDVKATGCAYCKMATAIHSCEYRFGTSGAARCSSNADCSCHDCSAEGVSPTCDTDSGLCKCDKPCGGDCGDGKYCCRGTDMCNECPDYCPGLQCPPGYEPKEPPAVWEGDTCGLVNVETCELSDPGMTPDCSVEAACQTLPDIALGKIGRFNDYVVTEHNQSGQTVRTIHMAAYNDGDGEGHAYGDLMYAAMPLAMANAYPTDDPEANVAWEFVDGVPADGVPSGNPFGPRGGVIEEGDDVGMHISIQVGADGQPMISYYDKTNGDLKFARRTVTTAEDDSQTVAWAIHTVDANGDTGYYTQLYLTPAGVPVIAYMMAKSQSEGANTTSALKLAIAGTETPAATEDWTIVTVDETVNPVYEEASTLVNLTDGIGLWPQVVQFPQVDGLATSNMFAIFYYHHNSYSATAAANVNNGNLKVATLAAPIDPANPPATGDFTVKIVAGENASGVDTGDMGLYPSVAVNGLGYFVVSFVDATMHKLMLYRQYEDNGGSMATDLIVADEGLRNDQFGNQFVAYNGADGSVVLDSSGMVRVAYQDQSFVELRYLSMLINADVGNTQDFLTIMGGTRNGSCNNGCYVCPAYSSYACTGAYGFYLKQVLVASESVIGSFYYDLPKDPDGYGIWFLLY